MKIFFTTLFCICSINFSELRASDVRTNNLGVSIRFTWWRLPEKADIFYITSGKEHIMVNPGVLSFTKPINYVGGTLLSLSKKVESKDSEGKPIITYVPTVSIDLEKVRSSEVGIILIPNQKSDAIYYQLLNLSEEEFPYGSLYLVNFTKTKISASLNGTILRANQGEKVKSMTFKENTIIDLLINGQDKEGNVVTIASSEIILDSSFRRLYLVGEKPVEGTTVYNIKSIVDTKPNNKEAPSDKTNEKSLNIDSKSKKSPKAAQ